MKKKEDFNGEKMDDPTEEVKGQPSEEKEKPQLTAEEIERKQGKLQCDIQIYVYRDLERIRPACLVDRQFPENLPFGQANITIKNFQI